MIITYSGIILFELIEWMIFIKEHLTAHIVGFGISYDRLRQRHPV
jgi:hypothetical protein